MADKLGYKVVTQATPVQVKAGPGGLFGLIVISSSAGTVTIYDGIGATGNILYTKTGLVVGADLVFSGIGMAAQNGIYVVVGGTATVNVLYT